MPVLFQGPWLLALGALAPSAANDDAVVLRPLVATSIPSRDERRHTVTWKGQSIPLATPVRDCAFGESADGRRLAILAGGIRESLDLYIVDRDEGLLLRLPTLGGRCLTSTFNGGAGSLPVLDGRELVLFAFERDGRVHFRAVDCDGGVHASRELPLTTRGFEVISDQSTSQVTVTFSGISHALTFDHPSAPRLEVEPWIVSFPETTLGDEAQAKLRLRNRGSGPVDLDLPRQLGEFRLKNGGPCTIPAGSELVLTVLFAPTQPGQRLGQLSLRPRRAPKELKVQVRGSAHESVMAVANCVEPLAELIAAPQAAPSGAGVEPGAGQEHFAAARQEATSTSAGSERSAPEPAPRREPKLALAGEAVQIEGFPGQAFVLAARLSPAGGKVARALLPGLRGRLDAFGKASVPLSSLGPITERFGLIALIASPDGSTLQTPTLELGPRE